MNFNNIENVINKWLYKNDFECTAKYGSDFVYDDMEEEITFALLVSEKHDQLFKKVFEDNGLLYECDMFILSFFHELGHFNTLHLLTEKEININDNFNDTDKDFFKYYNLPREIIATKWAINYINNNEEKIKDFWNSVQKEILKSYEKLLDTN